jgi:hypothetical protein
VETGREHAPWTRCKRAHEPRLRIPGAKVGVGRAPNGARNAIWVQHVVEPTKRHRRRLVLVLYLVLVLVLDLMYVADGVRYRPWWERWCVCEAFVLEVRDQPPNPATCANVSSLRLFHLVVHFHGVVGGRRVARVDELVLKLRMHFGGR